VRIESLGPCLFSQNIPKPLQIIKQMVSAGRANRHICSPPETSCGECASSSFQLDHIRKMVGRIPASFVIVQDSCIQNLKMRTHQNPIHAHFLRGPAESVMRETFGAGAAAHSLPSVSKPRIGTRKQSVKGRIRAVIEIPHQDHRLSFSGHCPVSDQPTLFVTGLRFHMVEMGNHRPYRSFSIAGGNSGKAHHPRESAAPVLAEMDMGGLRKPGFSAFADRKIAFPDEEGRILRQIIPYPFSGIETIPRQPALKIQQLRSHALLRAHDLWTVAIHESDYLTSSSIPPIVAITIVCKTQVECHYLYMSVFFHGRLRCLFYTV